MEFKNIALVNFGQRFWETIENLGDAGFKARFSECYELEGHDGYYVTITFRGDIGGVVPPREVIKKLLYLYGPED